MNKAMAALIDDAVKQLNIPTELYEAAIKEFGSEAQVKMVIEECAELIKALNDLDRGKCNKMEVLGEVADVEIMLEQLKIILAFPPEVYASIKQRKLSNLKALLDDLGAL